MPAAATTRTTATAIVYDFPKTRLVDGPLQIEARIDQNAQLSGQLSLWNQQGSHVRRGSLIVIPVGRALLYAEPIYLQAERSPMPELRLVVLALQDRLAYGPTFEARWPRLFGNAPSTLSPAAAPPARRRRGAAAHGRSRADRRPPPPIAATSTRSISGAARDLADYQRLTAEGQTRRSRATARGAEAEAGAAAEPETVASTITRVSRRRTFPRGAPDRVVRSVIRRTAFWKRSAS